MSEPEHPDDYPIFPEEGQRQFPEQPFVLTRKEVAALFGLWLKKHHGWGGNVYVSWRIHMGEGLQLQIHPIFTAEDLLNEKGA